MLKPSAGHCCVPCEFSNKQFFLLLFKQVKLLSRIASPLDDMNDDRSTDGNGMESEASAVHDSTYGITSDPLTQFACAFTALIHDVDHPGVPNAQLVQEEAPLANEYQNRSCAEQHSLNISWDLFMGNAFDDLRSMICPTPKELQRFRQLVVNCVMATDIADKDLKNLRNARWDKAFKNGVHESHEDGNPRDEVNRKATIVIEHLIQASDVAHVMQHWHVYR